MPNEREDQQADHLKTNAQGSPEDPSCNACIPATGGPVREKGGTTGENNLSAGGANRTGGATSGVVEDDPTQPRAQKLTPDP
jgi:hypothetical protein